MTSRFYYALVFLLFLLGVGVFIGLTRRGQAVASEFKIVPTSSSTRPSPPPQTVAPAVLPAADPSGVPNQEKAAAVEIRVHVAGAVKKPGVYRFGPDARAEDAVKAAGGAKPDANLDAINLAAKLEDGKQLYVPTKKELEVGGAPSGEQVAVNPQATGPPASGSKPEQASAKPEKFVKPGDGTVNINTATEEVLQRLPGVGPSYAARIIRFRKENGPFSAPEDLMNVSGIGEKKFEKMRPFVRVR